MLLRDRITRYMESKGCQQVDSKSSKYRKFVSKDDKFTYFLGKKGAVRLGKVVSKSTSVSDIVKKNMIKWEIENDV